MIASSRVSLMEQAREDFLLRRYVWLTFLKIKREIHPNMEHQFVICEKISQMLLRSYGIFYRGGISEASLQDLVIRSDGPATILSCT